LTVLLIDLAILGTIAFCAWRGYKNGLIRGVFGVVSLILALIFANIAASAYSEDATDMLKPFVGGLVDTALSEMVEEGVEYDPAEHDHDNDAPEFGTAYNALRRIGMPEPAAVSIAGLVQEEEEHSAFLTDVITEKLSIALSYITVFGVAFLIIAIIFAIVGNLIGFVFSLPGLKLVDIIAGISFGVIKGIIIVLSLAVIIRYLGLLAPSTLESTGILNYLVHHNFIANMLGV